MKIVVYAICKNEAKFAARWAASMSEADEMVVLDTGSDDDTVARLRACGVRVSQAVIAPWRFDEARNRSLDLVPEDADICVCTDLDEMFHPGWREILEQAWEPGTTRAAYRYVWSFQPDGSPGGVFWPEKIHARQGYRWTHPIHEVLERIPGCGPGPRMVVEDLCLEHHPDPHKSRAQYLTLLEQAVREAPEDDRNMHYLGREYLYYGKWDQCIETLQRHLAMPRSVWADERSASMRYIARSYWEKGEADQARRWYLRAMAEAPHLREPYVELARLLYRQKDWDGVVWTTRLALAIAEPPKSYINEGFAWGSLPWDLLSLGLYYTGRIRDSLDPARKALALEPDNERLRRNVELIEERLERAEDRM